MNSKYLIALATVITSLCSCMSDCYCMNELQNTNLAQTNKVDVQQTIKNTNPKLTTSTQMPLYSIDFTNWDLPFNDQNQPIDEQKLTQEFDKLNKRFNESDTNIKNIISKLNESDTNIKHIISKLDVITKEITEIKKYIQTNTSYNKVPKNKPIITNNKQQNISNSILRKSTNPPVKQVSAPQQNFSQTGPISYSSSRSNVAQQHVQPVMQQYQRTQSTNYGQNYTAQLPYNQDFKNQGTTYQYNAQNFAPSTTNGYPIVPSYQMY